MWNVVVRLRVFATIVVVAYHCVCPYYMWQWMEYEGDSIIIKSIIDFIFLHILGNTMLPTFFMISGMLFYANKTRYSNLAETFWKKFDRLVIPFCIIFTLSEYCNFDRIGVASASGHLWFVRELFLFFVISIVSFRINELNLFVLGCISYVLYVFSCKIGFHLNEIINHFLAYYIFFIGGAFVVKYYDCFRVRRVKVLLIFFSVMMLLQGLQSLYVLFFNLMLVSVTPSSVVKSKIVTSLNRSSYGIYLVHHILIFGIFHIAYINHLYKINALLAISMMFLFSFVLSWSLTCFLKKKGLRYI